jgi:2-iminobutanoate/2-iminopropanoate deaminase
LRWQGRYARQIQQVGENIKTCLEAVGATLADIVKTNTYVIDYPEFAKHPDMRMRYFGPATPTSTTVQISRLADPDAMVEIEAIAVFDG